MTVNQTSVSLDDAQRVIAAGQAKATEIESPSNIAVVDAGGNLVAHVRMDGAWIASIQHSGKQQSRRLHPNEVGAH